MIKCKTKSREEAAIFQNYTHKTIRPLIPCIFGQNLSHLSPTCVLLLAYPHSVRVFLTVDPPPCRRESRLLSTMFGSCVACYFRLSAAMFNMFNPCGVFDTPLP
eukprot:332644-Amphidinium_carterae.1